MPTSILRRAKYYWVPNRRLAKEADSEDVVHGVDSKKVLKACSKALKISQFFAKQFVQ